METLLTKVITIVVYAPRVDARHPGSGGEQFFYAGTLREHSSPGIPTISQGIDVRGVIGVIMDAMDIAGGGVLDLHKLMTETPDQINQRLSQLPDGPDETLL